MLILCVEHLTILYLSYNLEVHKFERTVGCVEVWGRFSRSGLTQDIKLGSCIFQCDVPYQWIAKRQVGPVSVYLDGVGCHVVSAS